MKQAMHAGLGTLSDVAARRRGAAWVGLALTLTACAPTKALVTETPVSTATLRQRTAMLAQLATTALLPCSKQVSATDFGLLTVSARPDGTITLGPQQWLGSIELAQCLTSATLHAQLPPWSGPAVTWLWPIGSDRQPAPSLLAEPAGYHELPQTLLSRGDLATQLRSCQPANTSILARVFVFPDGHIAGVTPLTLPSPPPTPTCIRSLERALDSLRTQTLPPFPGPGYFELDLALPLPTQSLP